ncbi:MAG: hypothetical protein AAF125_25705, partial [Chloroflexota bacterium]
ALIDADYNVLYEGDTPIVCDDAGNPNLCWGESASLIGSYVSRTRGRQLPGGQLDAMLSIPVDASVIGGAANFIVNSAQNTFGDYIMVFHMGVQ